MGLKQLLTNLEKGTVEGIADSQPFYSNYNNGGPGYDDFGNSTSLFDNPTDLFKSKSFKFGQGRAFDRPLGEFSNEPFIKAEDEQRFTIESQRNTLESFNIPRGGISLAGARARTDKDRIKNFFKTPKGRAFRIKQTGLQLMNPKIESNFKFSDQVARTEPDEEGNTRFDFGGTIKNIIDNGGLAFYNNANRTYNPLGTNTTKQVRNNHLGIHYDKSGLLPINAINNPKSSYEVIAGGGKSPNESFDRLRNLRKEHIVDNTVPLETKLTNSPVLNFIVDTVKGALGFSAQSILYEYVGGPNSMLGIGRTRIRKFQNSGYPAYFRNDLKDGEQSKTHILTINEAGYKSFPSPDSMIGEDGKARGVYDPPIPGVPIPDITNIFGGEFTNQDSKQLYRENFANTGNPGTLKDTNPVTGLNSDKRNLPYTQVIDKAIDKINAASIIEYKYEGGSGSLADHVATQNDFIKFYFDVYTDNVNESGKSRKTHRIQFRAFLDSLNDNFNGNWNEYNYAGRAEPFYTYKSFKRTISFSFKIAAQSRKELNPLYEKLNFLASTTAPTYSDSNDDNSPRMRGTFVKATIGDYLDRVPGFFDTIQLSWSSVYPWEIKLGKEKEKDVYQLPHILDVQCGFTPIHNFVPQTSTKYSPFILPLVSSPDFVNQERFLNPQKK